MTNETNKIDVSVMNEAALEGINHLLSKDNWTTLLGMRMKDLTNIQPLSADFIVKHKNDIGLQYLAMFGSLMMDDPNVGKGYNLDFFHRFWKFSQFDGGSSCTLMYTLNRPGNKGTFKREILDKQCNIDTIMHCGDTNPNDTLPTFQDYEKNPYFYDAGQLGNMVLFRDDVPVDFADRFIHLFPFMCVFSNQRLNKKQKTEFLNRFGIALADDRYLFPDGTVVSSKNFNDSEEGEAFYDNVLRYKTEDESAIRAIIAKWPRAIQDCFYPENALAMKAK